MCHWIFGTNIFYSTPTSSRAGSAFITKFMAIQPIVSTSVYIVTTSSVNFYRLKNFLECLFGLLANPPHHCQVLACTGRSATIK